MNKASGGDGIPVELFQILKDDAVKVLHSICQQIWENSAVATGLEKVSFHSNPKERQCQRMLKLLHIALISHASKVMLKILESRLQQYVNRELPDVQASFTKGKGTEIKLPTSAGSLKTQESSRKTSISILLTMPKNFTAWITINCGKFWKRWEYQTPDLPLEKPVCRSGSNS